MDNGGDIETQVSKDTSETDSNDSAASLEEYADQMNSVVPSGTGSGYRYKTNEVSKGGDTDN